MITMTNQEAAEAIRAHHVELQSTLTGTVDALRDAVRNGRPWHATRDDVLRFLDTELLPHAAAEERALYPAGATGATASLVAAMIDEHGAIIGRVGALRTAVDPIDAVAEASAVLALFEVHLAKENDRLIPALVADPSISLESLLAGMHELLG